MFGFMLSSYRPSAGRSGATTGELRSIAKDSTRDVTRRLEGLELACAGLWELLKTKHGYSDDDLVAMIREVDLRDGKLDGKITKSARDCPSCGRKLLLRKSPNCSWCGAAVGKGLF